MSGELPLALPPSHLLSPLPALYLNLHLIVETLTLNPSAHSCGQVEFVSRYAEGDRARHRDCSGEGGYPAEE